MFKNFNAYLVSARPGVIVHLPGVDAREVAVSAHTLPPKKSKHDSDHNPVFKRCCEAVTKFRSAPILIYCMSKKLSFNVFVSLL